MSLGVKDTLILVLILLLLLASPAGAMEVRWVVDGEAAEDISGVLELRAVGGITDTTGQAPVDRTARPGEEIAVDLPPGTYWRLSLRADGWWAPPRVFEALPEGERVTLHALPTTRFGAPITVEEGLPLPPILRLRFESSPDATTPQLDGRHEVICPVAVDRFVCEPPVGRYDLRLRAEGFVSHYFWDRHITPEPPKVAPVHLRPGASVVGAVSLPAGAGREFSWKDVELTLVPTLAGRVRSDVDMRRQTGLGLVTHPDKRGFFEWTGLPAGSYRLDAIHPAYRGRFEPIVVYPRAETEVPDVELLPPLRLAVTVEPQRSPFRTPWRVTVFREENAPGQFDKIDTRETNPEGVVTFEDFVPGVFRVTVEDHLGRRWWSEERALGNASETLTVSLPYHRLEALVLLGGEPLPGAEVAFTSRQEDGLGGERIGARTNEEGKVFVFLPTRPAWRAEVRSEEPRVGKVFEDLVPVREAGWDRHRWTLRLPDGRLSGRVTRVDGGPVDGAHVRLLAQDEDHLETHRHTVDADGSFEIRALAPGRLTLQAFRWVDGRFSSRRHEVTVTEGDNGPVELVLQASKRLEGQVFGPEGTPVLGARIDAVVLDASPGALPMEALTAQTGAGGEFSLEVPAEAGAVGLTVRPPGFDLQQFGPLDPGDSPVLLSVGQVGGTLRVEGIPTTGDPRTRWRPLLYGRHRLGLFELTSWSRAFGGVVDLTGENGVVEIPRLAPGTYHLCAGPGLLLWRTPPLGSPTHACVQGDLAPFGVVTLEVPTVPGAD